MHLCVNGSARVCVTVCLCVHQRLKQGGWAVKSSGRTGRCDKWSAVLKEEKQEKPDEASKV